MSIFDESSWNLSAMNEFDYLVEPNALDNDFITIFMKSAQLCSQMVPEHYFSKIRETYLEFVNDQCGGYETLEEAASNDVPWTGYHDVVCLFRRMEQYGVQGQYHYMDDENPSNSEALRTDLQLAYEFHEQIPANWLELTETGGKGQLGAILHAAQARYALDTGKDLTIGQVVVLSRMNRRSVLNALSGNNETKLRSIDGIIPHAEALRWLSARRSFVPTSRFSPTQNPFDDNENEIVGPEVPLDYVFIPQASDGSQFRPEHRRDQGYQIGAKGDQTYVQDYFEALEHLHSMPVPRWRRPNEQGNWGIVTAQAWIRVPRGEVSPRQDNAEESA